VTLAPAGGIVVPQSLGTINETGKVHAQNPVEMQANTLAYYYFGMPDNYISGTSQVDIFSIRFNYIKIPTSILYEIQNGYLNHPNYRP
jgi:hypothetical protein